MTPPNGTLFPLHNPMMEPLSNALSNATWQMFTVYQVQTSTVALISLFPFGDSVISKWFGNFEFEIPGTHSCGSLMSTSIFFLNLMTAGI